MFENTEFGLLSCWFFLFSNRHFVGRLYAKLMTIQISCITPLARRVVEWFLVGMYDNRTLEIKKLIKNPYISNL